MLVTIDGQHRIDPFIDYFGEPRTSGPGGASLARSFSIDPREPRAGDTAQG